MMNIFYNHWLKRDGGIYKDLAFLTHNERIEYVEDLIGLCNDCIKHGIKHGNKEIIRINTRCLRYYNRLMDYIMKNPNIPVHKGFKSYSHYLANNMGGG